MNTNYKSRNIFNIIVVTVTLVCCLGVFCGCHVFAWYIPKPYSDKEEAEIYGFIKQELLTELSQYVASIMYEDADGGGRDYNVFVGEGKVIINSTLYSANVSAISYSVWYDGTLREWNNQTRTEAVTEVDISEYRFLFDDVMRLAEFIRTKVVNVASYRDDSYFWECFPWGMGMAQMYYDDVDGVSVTGSWEVEKKSAVRKGLPWVFSAQFDCSTDDGYAMLDVYGSPYGIEERITNMLKLYEEYKERPQMIEDVNVYLTMNGEKMSLSLYDNATTRVLIDKLYQCDVTVTVEDYGDFEKVGSLGFSLPTNDERITTEIGEVVLYQGDKITLFYGQNTWEYTRLGYIVGYSSELLVQILRDTDGATQITLSIGD